MTDKELADNIRNTVNELNGLLEEAHKRDLHMRMWYDANAWVTHINIAPAGNYHVEISKLEPL